MSSVTKAEVDTVHHNGKVAISIRTALIELGHKHGPTPIKTDNNTADGFFNKKIKPKRSKLFYMKFHWMEDRNIQKLSYVYWDKGINDRAYYSTKHHPPIDHRLMERKYIQMDNKQSLRLKSQLFVQGCVQPPLTAVDRLEKFTR